MKATVPFVVMGSGMTTVALIVTLAVYLLS
jgi:hypothetical protein